MPPFGPWPGVQNLPFPWATTDVVTDAGQVVSTVGFTTVQTLNMAAATVAGTYDVFWYCETFQSATANSAEVQVLVDGVVQGDTRHGDEADIVDVHEHTGLVRLALAAGAHTIVMQASVTAGTVTVRRRRLTATRIT